MISCLGSGHLKHCTDTAEGRQNGHGTSLTIKRWFSAAIPPGEDRSASRVAKAERGLWQRRFWEHTVRDDTDFARHVDYVHFNPVKHGLAASAADWPYSSFRQAVARGLYPAGWAHQGGDAGDFGESETSGTAN
jgi:putative transposase